MVTPSTLEEWQSAIATGTGPLSTRRWRGIAELRAEDLVVRVRSGESVAGLNTALAEHGLCLPYLGDGALHTLIAQNLPHGLEAQHGTWRDWVLGMTLVQGDGTVARSGSMVVKSVAGYDVHKLLIGAHGALAFVAEVTLRLIARGSLREPELETNPVGGEVRWIQRVLATDWSQASGAAVDWVQKDPTSFTLWHGSSEAPKRFAGDWLMTPDGRSADPDPHPDLTARAYELLPMPRDFQVI